MSGAVLDTLARAGIVPVHADTDTTAVVEAVRACYAGGVRAFEFADRVPGAVDIFRDLHEVVRAEMPDLALGAGTVTTVASAKAFAAAGATFLVSPVLAEEVLAWSVASGTPFVPGVVTPTEAWRAHVDGAEVVKLFPAATFGPGYLKSILAPLPRLRVLATGGIKATPAAVEEWLAAGAFGVGLGSDLIPKGRLSSERLAALTSACLAITASLPPRMQRP